MVTLGRGLGHKTGLTFSTTHSRHLAPQIAASHTRPSLLLPSQGPRNSAGMLEIESSPFGPSSRLTQMSLPAPGLRISRAMVSQAWDRLISALKGEILPS